MRCLLSALCLSVTALLVVACAPKKKPDPKVTAETQAAVAAAGEGMVAAIPTPGSSTAASMSPTGAKSSLPVLGPAPAWKLTDVDGKAVTSDQFKGKVVVLDFWATWCPPCREEIPGYTELARKYGDKLVIVGVSLDEAGPKVVQPFMKKMGINYPIVMGDEAVVSAFGGVKVIPTTFLIDRNGQIRDRKDGALPTEQYEKKIAALIE